MSDRTLLERIVRPLRGRRGISLIEPVVATAASAGVVLAVITVYVSTIRSWEGTAALADVQREASLAMEVMTRNIRPGSTVSIAGGDSIEVFLRLDGGADSLIARYYLDTAGNLRDNADNIVTTRVDSLGFTSPDNQTVNIDVVLKNEMDGDRASDDQSVLMSSTVICRN
ncbi:MAG: hypothetical protein JXB46_07950 [Candidatus Eisenbacteria bacterium]|nr:hypothetical protein [Candidatus Eisenbacteria bacterium]